MKMTAATHPGCRHTENQDRYRAGRLADGTHWVVLCDGMGGVDFGGVASEMAISYLSDAIEKRLPDLLTEQSVKQFLVEAAQRVSRMIFDESRSTGEPSVTMGTTVVMAVIRGNICQFVHAGDSRLYLLQRGVLRQLTKDHSIVQELLDSGRISAEQAHAHPNKNIITSALGIDANIRIDAGEHKVVKGERLLACSDGLSNMLTDGEIAEILRNTEFFSAAEALVQASVLAGGYDNITAVVAEAE